MLGRDDETAARPAPYDGGDGTADVVARGTIESRQIDDGASEHVDDEHPFADPVPERALTMPGDRPRDPFRPHCHPPSTTQV